MVLGVFALSNQQGARYDDMHADPTNPGAMTFVSAVYAVNTMFGSPWIPSTSTLIARACLAEC